MIDELRTLAATHFGVPKNTLRFTKFCQRIVQPHTKVLFLVTHKDRCLCIIKTVRFPQFNENLRREKRAQEASVPVGRVRAPEVYFDGMVRGRYIYAEEVIIGSMLTLSGFKKNMPEIDRFMDQLPKKGTITKEKLQETLHSYMPDLMLTKDVYTLGLTHGDVGRPNVLETKNELVVIDWERAGDIPVLDEKVQAAYQRLYKKQPEQYRALVEVFHFDI